MIHQRQRLTIKRLRDDLPHWTWTAEQTSFGSYAYHGMHRNDRSVTVHACAMLSGDDDETAVVRWFVTEGRMVESYTCWAFRQSMDRTPPTVSNS